VAAALAAFRAPVEERGTRFFIRGSSRPRVQKAEISAKPDSNVEERGTRFSLQKCTLRVAVVGGLAEAATGPSVPPRSRNSAGVSREGAKPRYEVWGLRLRVGNSQQRQIPANKAPPPPDLVSLRQGSAVRPLPPSEAVSLHSGFSGRQSRLRTPTQLRSFLRDLRGFA
jgi:hypothetical protein